MSSLLLNWIIILVLGFIIARYLKPFDSFYSGIISLVIATVITYVIHSFWIASNNLIWALIAVSHASFWSGLFSSMNS